MKYKTRAGFIMEEVPVNVESLKEAGKICVKVVGLKPGCRTKDLLGKIYWYKLDTLTPFKGDIPMPDEADVEVPAINILMAMETPTDPADPFKQEVPEETVAAEEKVKPVKIPKKNLGVGKYVEGLVKSGATLEAIIAGVRKDIPGYTSSDLAITRTYKWVLWALKKDAVKV